MGIFEIEVNDLVWRVKSNIDEYTAMLITKLNFQNDQKYIKIKPLN